MLNGYLSEEDARLLLEMEVISPEEKQMIKSYLDTLPVTGKLHDHLVTCGLCRKMQACGLFDDSQVLDYHEKTIPPESFTVPQQEIIASYRERR